MCGRYEFSLDPVDEKMKAIVSMMDRRYPGSYKTGEIFPGDTVPGLIAQQGKIVPIPAVFGIPGIRDGKLLINARSETADRKRTFSDSLRRRRIILPASGFYEWSHDGQKSKYRFTGDRPTLYLCGLYSVSDGQCRFVVLTRAANVSVAEVHDRMPVLVSETEVRPYLTDYRFACGLLAGTAPELNRELTR